MTATTAPFTGAAGAAGAARLVRFGAIAFALLFTLARWSPSSGYTSLIRFGATLAEPRIRAVRALPIALSPGDGYDGQWYAQIAVDPHVTSPEVIAALDKPSYRARRILVPLVANLLGGGDPWRVLQAYVLLHVAAWLALAALLWRMLPLTDPAPWRTSAAWFGAAMGTGALDSMRMTLSDVPAALGVALAVFAIERGRPRLAALALLTAGFVREVSLGALFVLRAATDSEAGSARRAAVRRTWLLRIAAAAPVVVWCAWLAWRIPGKLGHEGNIDWPGVAFVSRLAANIKLIMAGDHDNQWWFGILGGLGLAAQSVFVLRRWRLFSSNPWVAVALPFAVLFWLIGTDPWIDYRAVARDCLLMTIGFNMLWAREREANPTWMLANISVVDGLARLTWP